MIKKMITLTALALCSFGAHADVQEVCKTTTTYSNVTQYYGGNFCTAYGQTGAHHLYSIGGYHPTSTERKSEFFWGYQNGRFITEYLSCNIYHPLRRTVSVPHTETTCTEVPHTHPDPDLFNPVACEFGDPQDGTTPGCHASSIGGYMGIEAFKITKNGSFLLNISKETIGRNCTISVSGFSANYGVAGNCSNYIVSKKP